MHISTIENVPIECFWESVYVVNKDVNNYGINGINSSYGKILPKLHGHETLHLYIHV